MSLVLSLSKTLSNMKDQNRRRLIINLRLLCDFTRYVGNIFKMLCGFQGSFLRGLADILKKYYFVGHHELKAAAKKLYRSVFLIHSSPRGSRRTKRHSNRTARRTLHQGFQLMGQTPCSLASQVASAGHRTISWRLVSEEKQSPPVSPV